MKWTAGVLAIGVVILAPDQVLACPCTETGTVRDELKSSRAVFLGRVIALAIETVALENSTAERMRATFKVERRWKSATRSTIEVWTCGDQTAVCTCGLDFKLGERYVVFASGQPLGTGSCDRTRVASAAEAIIAELEKLSPAAKGRITMR